jgi:hypothetical protein
MTVVATHWLARSDARTIREWHPTWLAGKKRFVLQGVAGAILALEQILVWYVQKQWAW